MKVSIITDASYDPVTKAGGWAAWITSDLGRAQCSGQFKTLFDNAAQAELGAAINGLCAAQLRFRPTHVLLQTDCLAVVEVTNTSSLHNSQAHLASMWRQAKATYFPDLAITARHVKGHTSVNDARSYCNRWCDKHAKRHMRTHRLRLSNELVVEGSGTNQMEEIRL